MSKNKKQFSIASVAFILVLGALAPMLDTTMTNVAINTIMNDLHSSVNMVQWVTTGYVLALGLCVLITGWAIERLSGKTLYFIGITIFLVGSIISGMANSITVLIIGRLIQGAGSGVIIPLLSTLIVRLADGKGLGSLMAIIGLPAVLAPILGPTIGGFIVKQLDWHWIFYINIPLSILSFLLIWWLMPQFEATQDGKKFDIISFLSLGGMFTALIFSIVNFSSHGNLSSMQVLLPLIIGIALLVFYVVYAQMRPARAMISLKLFSYGNFMASGIILMMSGIVVNGAMFLLPLYLQNVQGLSVIDSGLFLIAQGLGLLIVRTQIGKLTDRFGARWPVIISILLAIASTVPFIYFDAHTSYWLILIALLFRGMAQGGLTIPVMSDSYVGLPKDLISEATTATRMLQNIGGAFGTAILATIIQNQLTGSLPTVTHLTTAYQVTFKWSIIITTVALIPAWFLSHRSNLRTPKEK